ncbi:hypothetical protein [Aliihoeflea sp. 2WW]|uniref:hypothetical protein n=1 Tax=Aliihoeflea sp. 2WW TaxID=1381123 RepID=UPI001268D1D5|nr:hypothetical protein [Aliihoeflea sp. 2WW]
MILRIADGGGNKVYRKTRIIFHTLFVEGRPMAVPGRSGRVFPQIERIEGALARLVRARAKMPHTSIDGFLAVEPGV